MTKITLAAIRRLRKSTGSSLARCRAALEAHGGDESKAESKLRVDSLLDNVDLSLKNQFLIAMPGMEDDNFSNTVSLLCEHNDKGAIGLVINRPTELTLNAMLDQMGVKHEATEGSEQVVFWGGPVQPERGFVVHREPGGWESCMPIGSELYITTSRDVLTAIGEGRGPKEYLITLGYAGWGAGQLENEILANSWLNTPVDPSVLFQTPARSRWQSATRLIGLEVSQISSGAGHS
ncbi:MAG: YqgE/AlgH family protein [Panacagrimonas sp.]